MTTCAPLLFTCVVRYASILCSADFSLRELKLEALRPQRDETSRREDLFMSGTLQYSDVGLSPYTLSSRLTCLMSTVSKNTKFIPAI